MATVCFSGESFKLNVDSMRRRLSSLQTGLMKIIFPALWIPSWGFVVVMMFFGGVDDGDPFVKWFFLFAAVVGAAFICWSSIRLKEVSVDDNFLYVSNYLKEVSIPLSDIYDVTENVWINIHPVTIHLKSPSEFGYKITFMPKTRLFAFFSSHPVVRELKVLAARSNMAARSIR
jgi:hypothetical protein